MLLLWPCNVVASPSVLQHHLRRLLLRLRQLGQLLREQGVVALAGDDRLLLLLRGQLQVLDGQLWLRLSSTSTSRLRAGRGGEQHYRQLGDGAQEEGSTVGELLHRRGVRKLLKKWFRLLMLLLKLLLFNLQASLDVGQYAADGLLRPGHHLPVLGLLLLTKLPLPLEQLLLLLKFLGLAV